MTTTVKSQLFNKINLYSSRQNEKCGREKEEWADKTRKSYIQGVSKKTLCISYRPILTLISALNRNINIASVKRMPFTSSPEEMKEIG